MTDRFSVQLRQHLLNEADERPAEGQLARVVDTVATTRQRLPLVARLRGDPGRIGLFPAAAVRFGLVAAALALAMTTGAMLAGGTGPTTVFDGAWTSTDPADGSVQILVVGPGNTPAVYFEDGYATGAACVSDAVKRFTARGTGGISGSRLVVAYPDGGGCGLVTVKVATRYDYLAASDTLIDQDGVIWTRALGGDQSGTKAPATQTSDSEQPVTEPSPGTQPTAAAEATPDGPPSDCVDLYEDGGTYLATVGTISVTATVPAGWVGLRDQFYLQNSACLFGGSLKIEVALLSSVYADACKSRGSEVEASTPAAVIDAFSGQEYVTAGPTDLTIDGYAASRIDLSFPAGLDTNKCDEGTLYLAPGDPDPGLFNFARGTNLAVYVVDVDGAPLVVAASNWFEDEIPASDAELDEIVASLRFEP